MPTPINPQVLLADVSQGVFTSTSYRIAPQNSVANAVNIDFSDVYGEASIRKGTSRIGSAAVNGTNDIDGLFQFVDSAAGANSKLIASSGGTIYSLEGNTWTSSLTGDTSGEKVRFATFLDRVVRQNGTDAPKAWSGSGAWETSSGPLDLSNMPIGDFVGVFCDQMFVINPSGVQDSIKFSSVPASPSYSSISWTTDSRTIIINPDDGGNITGWGQIGGQLIIFKNDGMFSWNNRATQADKTIDVGCSSHESISSGGNLLFFFNARGIWATQGAYPILISGRVQKWIDGMDATFNSKVAGWCDNKYYFCSIGDCTVDDESYTNVVLRYTINTKEWTVYSYASKPLKLTQYISSGAVLTVYGDADSNIVRIEAGTNTDFNSSPIKWLIASHEQDFGSRARDKEISDKIIGYGSGLTDALVSIRSEHKDWKPVGSFNGSVSEVRFSGTNGRFFDFRVSGSSRTSQRFSGIELPRINMKDY